MNRWIKQFILLMCLVRNVLSSSSNSTGFDKKAGKFLSLFQVVSFPNDVCQGDTKNGTCYTLAECTSKGGTNGGACAQGYGVCCIVSIGCGMSTSENTTYFESNNSPASGSCVASICRRNNNICQLRLDFDSFVITGPSTITVSTVLIIGGVAVPGGAQASYASQCLTDTFSVLSSGGGSNPPTICGTNTGQHMYVDVDSTGGCAKLAFQLGNTAVGTTLAIRAWSMKVSQYNCDYPNLAPSGCTQYYFNANTNIVQTYNFRSGTGLHMANQNQNICVRKERNNCRICWTTMAPMDFAISGTGANAGFNQGTSCCGYGANGKGVNGFDCIRIPGATNANTPISMVCGRSGPDDVACRNCCNGQDNMLKEDAVQPSIHIRRL